MISSFSIRGYRGFNKFSMVGLGRINLLVGTNNSGKTSVLEAIHLLTAMGDPLALWQLLWRRGERLAPSPGTNLPDRPVRRSTIELDVSHLFYGHEAQLGASIQILADLDGYPRDVEISLAEIPPRDQPELFADDEPMGQRLALIISGRARPGGAYIPLSRAGGLYPDALDLSTRRQRLKSSSEWATPVLFITTESLTGDELVAMWNKIVLTPLESLVLRALQFLEPKIERVASQSASGPYTTAQARGGFILKLKGVDQPVPIGSMGDGMWRMLAMAIALTQCQGGVLIVDEIDTGLHYTVLAKMWKLLFSAAKEFDVQVFATTHSSDCIHSLGELSGEIDQRNSITVQRIEIGREKAVRYDADEIAIAAQREIEVR
jgi:hypothetical protein